MQENTTASPVNAVLRLVKNYVLSLAAVPAVCLHAVALMAGVMGVYILFSELNPAGTQSFVQQVAARFGVTSLRYQGNPFPFFIQAYFVLGIVVDAAAWILSRVFRVRWTWNDQKTFRLFCAIAGINCGILAVSFLADGNNDMFVPAFLLFSVTTFATAVPIALRRLFDGIRVMR